MSSSTRSMHGTTACVLLHHQGQQGACQHEPAIPLLRFPFYKVARELTITPSLLLRVDQFHHRWTAAPREAAWRGGPFELVRVLTSSRVGHPLGPTPQKRSREHQRETAVELEDLLQGLEEVVPREVDVQDL
jgi:hypothetical protein